MKIIISESEHAVLSNSYFNEVLSSIIPYDNVLLQDAAGSQDSPGATGGQQNLQEQN